MKKGTTICLVLLLSTVMFAAAQDARWTDTLTTKTIERHDGSIMRGRITAMDARELTVLLSDGTRLVLPKHLIRSITSAGEQVTARVEGDEVVPTAMYVLTSGAMPMPKGSSTLQFNLAGMALEAFPSERFSVGLISSWFSAPIVATAMYRMPLSDNVWLGAGGFVGWGGSLADRNFLAAPALTLTVLSGSASLSLTGGYGATSLQVEAYTQPDYSALRDTLQITSPRAYAALGVSLKLARKIRLIVDAFMISGSGSVTLPDGRWIWTNDYNYYDPSSDFTRSFQTYSNIFIIPAIRWEYGASSYWQFGFAGYKGNLLNLEDNSNWSPLPIPVVQWVITL
ncbi:MAG: hypothetical protein FGM33_09685 [Candidatus Kapabacteria bacterium]|nr:hypothetical protein [Candidatus Kapabacteria bacterium]